MQIKQLLIDTENRINFGEARRNKVAGDITVALQACGLEIIYLYAELWIRVDCKLKSAVCPSFPWLICEKGGKKFSSL